MLNNICSVEFIGSVSEEYAKLIENAIQSSAMRVHELLPLNDVRVKIQFNEKLVIPEYGVGGWCFNAEEINLTLAPNRERDWLLYLPRSLAHEWHHMARWRGNGYGTSLTDILISEGLAQHFEIECFQGEPSFYSCFLSERERQKMIEAFRIESTGLGSYDHAKWFFGAAQFPFLGGYDLSFYLTGLYLRAVKSLASKEVQLDAVKLLKYL